MPDPIFDGVFDAMFAPGAHIGVQGGDYSLTPAEYKDGLAWTIVGGSRSGASVNIPSGMAKVSVWRADPANTSPVFVRCGQAVQLNPGARLTILTDKNGRISATALGQPVGSSAWQTLTEGKTALAGEHLDADTTAAIMTITLPLDPAKFDEVYFRNSAQTFATHALTIARNGETIMGLAQDMTVNTNGADFSLWFNGETWQLPGAQL
jgi:hypothetical protein